MNSPTARIELICRVINEYNDNTTRTLHELVEHFTSCVFNAEEREQITSIISDMVSSGIDLSVGTTNVAVTVLRILSENS